MITVAHLFRGFVTTFTNDRGLCDNRHPITGGYVVTFTYDWVLCDNLYPITGDCVITVTQ